MTTPSDASATGQKPGKRGWKKRFSGRFLVISVILHLLFGGGAALWIVQVNEAKRQQQFRSSPPPANPGQRMTEHKVQMAKRQQTMSAPAPMKRVTVNAPSAAVSLPDVPAFPAAAIKPAAMSGMVGPGGFGFGPRQGMMSGAGGGSPVNLFGLRTVAKRIAFLVDYSGSMSGEFRTKMEQNLEGGLKKLPTGTEILIIPWAGPAWLYNQTAKQVAAKWKMVDKYDNFAVLPGATLDSPKWVAINSSNAANIMKGMRAQENAPGGTDWRQPFRYAMQAQPPPDVIFFMTDGQIPVHSADSILADIAASLKKAPRVPQVNCLWIENKRHKPEPLQQLATTYHGEFQTVGTK